MDARSVSWCLGQAELAAVPSIEIEELHERGLFERNSLLRGDGAQGGIDVRQMIQGDVAHKRASDLIVAHAPVQPAEEERELNEDRGKRDRKIRPGETHKRFSG